MQRLRIKTYVATEDMDPTTPATINRDASNRVTEVVMDHVSIKVTKTFVWDPLETEVTSFSRVIEDQV